MRLLASVFAAAMLVTAPSFGGTVDSNVVAALDRWSLPVPSPSAIVICHGYGCLYRTEVGFGPADRARLAQLLAPGKSSAAAERKAIAQAESWFERRVAPFSGTAHAKARSGGGLNLGGDPSQFDCIDTTANTTSFLIMLEQLGLLRHHRVSTPLSRLMNGGPHYTAVIEEQDNGQRWTVDPWPHDNGQLPDVWTVESWTKGLI